MAAGGIELDDAGFHQYPGDGFLCVDCIGLLSIEAPSSSPAASCQKVVWIHREENLHSYLSSVYVAPSAVGAGHDVRLVFEDGVYNYALSMHKAFVYAMSSGTTSPSWSRARARLLDLRIDDLSRHRGVGWSLRTRLPDRGRESPLPSMPR